MRLLQAGTGALFVLSCLLFIGCGDDVHMIRVTPDMLTLTEKGATVQLKSMGLTRTEVPVKTEGTFSYRSKDPAVATVSPDGTVTAVGNGQTNIVSELGDAFGESIIRVCLPKELTVQPTEMTLPIGGVQKVKAKLVDCEDKPIVTPTIEYEVNDKSKIQIEEGGTLIGLEAGDVILTVKSKGLDAQVKINIPPIPEELLEKMRAERAKGGHRGSGGRGGGSYEPDSNVSHLLKGWKFGSDGKVKVGSE